MKAYRLALMLCLTTGIAHAQTATLTKKFSDFPAASAIVGTELVPVLQASANKVTTPSALLTYIQSAIALPATALTSGNIAVARFNGGTSASSATFWRGDGTWATPAGSGTVTSSGPPSVGSIATFGTTTNLVTGNMSGDCTTTNTLVITCTQTGGTPFAASATLDATIATNITSGTLPGAQLPNPTTTVLGGAKALALVAHKFFTNFTTSGSFGAAQPACADLSDTTPMCAVSQTNGVTLGMMAQLAADKVLGNFTAATANMAGATLPSCSAASSALTYNTTTHAWGCNTISTGSGTPGGSPTQVQYNAAGSFSGITGATSNGTTLTLVAPVLGTPASGTMTNLTGLPLTTGVTGVLPIANGGTSYAAAPTSTANHPLALNAAVSTPNTTMTMMGLAGTITPATSGKILITVCGDLYVTTATSTVAYEIHYGTGSAPTLNQNPAIGTALGATMRAKPNAVNIRLPFSMTYIVTGQAIGTAMWIDLAYDTDNAANAANIENVNVVATEIP